MSKKQKKEVTETQESKSTSPVQDRLTEALNRDFAHVIVLGLTENDMVHISTSFGDYASIQSALARASVDVVIAHNNAARRTEETALDEVVG